MPEKKGWYDANGCVLPKKEIGTGYPGDPEPPFRTLSPEDLKGYRELNIAGCPEELISAVEDALQAGPTWDEAMYRARLLVFTKVLHDHGYDRIPDDRSREDLRDVVVFDSDSDQYVEVYRDGSWRYVNEYWFEAPGVIDGEFVQELITSIASGEIREGYLGKNNEGGN